MASTNNYINEYATLDEMNAAYESDHSGSWVAYCAEDNNLYYQQKTTISSKYFDNLEYNSENKTLDFYIDGEVKKSIDVSPWWFEKDSYYTREEVNNLLLPKFDNVVYESSARTINFYSGTEVKKSIDATDFIKDGMVDNVQVVVSSDTKSYLEITFNTDSEGQKTHDTVYLDLTKIFNPENYYTKSDSDGKYVTGLGTDNKSLTYTINGKPNGIIVPYAINCYRADESSQAYTVCQMNSADTLGDYAIRYGEKDYAATADTLANMVISSWYGISFTTSENGSPNQNKTTVGIDTRSGNIYMKGSINIDGETLDSNILKQLKTLL